MVTARLTPEDMPVQALGYGAFDAVLLDAAALDQLQQRQVDALGKWLRAGGRVGVLGGDAARLGKDWALHTFTSENGVTLGHAGLGHAVLVAANQPIG